MTYVTFVTNPGLVAAIIAHSYAVRFVQFRKESGVPFDTEGWTTMVVETMVVHISPGDIKLERVEDPVSIAKAAS